jgi:hypothetical protein
MEIKNAESGTFDAPEVGTVLISVEIGRQGIQRVYVISDANGVDEQADAHRLLAQVMPQLMLLDDALRSEGTLQAGVQLSK